jgi:hypothetical protein
MGAIRSARKFPIINPVHPTSDNRPIGTTSNHLIKRDCIRGTRNRTASLWSMATYVIVCPVVSEVRWCLGISRQMFVGVFDRVPVRVGETGGAEKDTKVLDVVGMQID